jgi:hypothetical protein
MIEQYLDEIDELEGGPAAEAGIRPAAAAADLEMQVDAVLKAAGPLRVRRPCRRRVSTAWGTSRRRMA